MATIVQPYNDWREQLAVNLIGGLLKDVIQRNQQRADNRIQNRALADFASATQPVTTNYLGSQNQSQGLTDGWTSAFHKGGNELANFDTYTANIAPQVAQQSQPQYYNPAQMVNSFMNILGSNRDYQALNTEQMMKLAAPYLAASEKMRQEYITKQIADKFMGAKTYDEKLNELTSGLINNAISPDIYKNAGDSLFNLYKFNNISAQQQFDNSYKDRVFTEDTRRWDKNFVEGQRQFNANNANELLRINNQNTQFNNRLALDQQQWNDQNNQILGSFTDKNGNMLFYDRYGNIHYAITPDGQRVEVNPYQNQKQNPYQWNKADDAQVAAFDDQIKSLEAEIERNIEISRDPSYKKEEQKKAEQEVLRLREQLLQTREAKQAYITRRTQENNNPYQVQQHQNTSPKRGRTLATEMIGAQFANVSPNGEYLNKNPNRKHKHQGTDYLAPKNTPIRVPYSLGGQWKVVGVETNPNNSGGVYVVMQKNINGKYYQIKTAHMAAGSLKVKPGDIVNPGMIIGLSGNTGTARGVNGGYHLHLETLIDGEYVDPEKFFDLIGNNANQQQGNITAPLTPNPAPQQNQQNNNNVQIQPTNNTQPTQQSTQTQQDNSPVIFRDESGKQMTQNEYNDLVRRVESGESPLVQSKEDLDKQLESRGFKRVDTQSTQNTSSLSVPDEPSIIGNPNITFNPPISQTSPDLTISSQDINVSSDINPFFNPLSKDVTPKSSDVNPISVDNSPTIFTNNNGEKITQNQYDEMLRNFKDKTELEMYLWHKGFKRVMGTPKNSTILGNNTFNKQIDFLNGYNRG